MTSDTSGPFLFSCVLRRRASTVVGAYSPARAKALRQLRSFSHSSEAASEDPFLKAGMNPEFVLLRQLILTLFTLYPRSDQDCLAAIKETADILRQILNTQQDNAVKQSCSEIIEIVLTTQEQEEETAEESEEKLNDEYVDVSVPSFLKHTLPSFLDNIPTPICIIMPGCSVKDVSGKAKTVPRLDPLKKNWPKRLARWNS